ncbi:hypothetical protein BVRB_017110, partial [Beta vulgaris subsp. vulgaris]
IEADCRHIVLQLRLSSQIVELPIVKGISRPGLASRWISQMPCLGSSSHNRCQFLLHILRLCHSCLRLSSQIVELPIVTTKESQGLGWLRDGSARCPAWARLPIIGVNSYCIS